MGRLPGLKKNNNDFFGGKFLIFLSVLLELLEWRRPDGVVRTEERQGVDERVRDVLKSLATKY